MNSQASAEQIVAGTAYYKVGDSLAWTHDQANPWVVLDYPYGFRLRTSMRVWFEHDVKKGMRICQQTQDPRTGRWNNPKKSTYSGALVMLFDQQGYLTSNAWDMTAPEAAEAFLARHGTNLPIEVLRKLRFAQAYSASMSLARTQAGELSYGTPAYKVAHQAAMLEGVRASKAE